MIFKPILIAKILEGRKTMTRRPVTGDKPCAYEPGKTYAIQPGMARRTVARIHVTYVGQEPLGLIQDDDAYDEGFDDADAFLAYWAELYGRCDLEQQVWTIRFHLVSIVADVCPTCIGKGVVPLAEDCHEPAGPAEVEAWVPA